MPDQNEVNEFLDALRESGVVNMFGAAAFIRQEWPSLSGADVKAFLTSWMRTFGERHAAAQPRRVERDGLFSDGQN